MNIYVTHSTGYDFRSELYAPLQTLADGRYTFIFPHEDSTFKNSKETIRTADSILAEVSYPSTGQGIELGWANNSDKPIICIHKEGTKPSGSLQAVSNTFIAYVSTEDMIEKLKTTLRAQT